MEIKARKTEKEHYFYIDILRCLATIAVVSFHVGAADRYQWFVTMVNNWCVPAFIAISGVVFLSKKENVTYKSMWKHVRKILVALIGWGWIYNILSLIIIDHRLTIDNVYRAFRMVIEADTSFCYQFWYLYMIIGLYLIIPLLHQFVLSGEKKDIASLLGVLVFFAILLPTFVTCFGGKFDRNFWKSAFLPFSGYMVYLLIGYWLHTYGLKRPVILGIVVTAAIQFAVASYLIAQGNIVYERLSGYQSLLSCELMVLLFVGVKAIAPHVEKIQPINFMIRTIASNSFGIFILHVALIQMFRKVCGMDCSFAPQYISIPVMMVVTLAASVFCTRIIKRIPLIRNYI